MTFLELAQKVLREANHPMSVEELWAYAKDKEYDVLTTTKGKTPWRTIAAQIYVDIRDNAESPFIKIDSKPRKFFLKDIVSRERLETIKEKEEGTVEAPSVIRYSERELHPLLTYFAYNYMHIYTKTAFSGPN